MPEWAGAGEPRCPEGRLQHSTTVMKMDKELGLTSDVRKAIDDELSHQGFNVDARKRVVDCLAGPRPTEGEPPPLVAGGAPP